MNILFYSDAVPIGGHELMSIRFANQLCRFDDFDVTFAAPESFFLKLDTNINKIVNNIRPRPLNGSLGNLFLNDYYALFKFFKSCKPDLIIVCQGTIELGIKAVIVAKLLGIKVVSYIPLVIDLVATGSPFFPRLRNFINDFLYMLPDGFVTISNYHKDEIYKKLESSPSISVLRNWVEQDDSDSSATSMTIRSDISHWALKQRAQNKKIILIIGRIEFKHKQQDKFLRLVCDGVLDDNISIIFAGSGSDSGKLISIIDNNRLSNVFYCGNVEQTNELYRMVDGVCICSSFEGVPLVMLESINCDLPVFSFDFEALRDYLPSNLLVPNQSFASLVEAINKYDFTNAKCAYKTNYKNPSDNEMLAVCKQIRMFFLSE